MEEKKLILSYFILIYKYANRNYDEPNWANLVQYIKDYGTNHPMKKMWEDLKPLGSKIVAALNIMFPDFIKVRNPDILRKEGVLSITLNPAELGMPSFSSVYNDILRAKKSVNWFLFGYFYSPEDLANNQTAQDSFKFIIPETLNITVFRDEVHPIIKDYDELFSYKTKTASMSKPKKILKEGVNDAFLNTGKYHRDRRVYLKQELNMLKHLLKDTPGLIAPKLPLILSALSFAKDEVLWWFRHRNPPSKSKISNLAHFEESAIVEMINLILHFQYEIFKRKNIIQQYYSEYLSGADYTRLSSLSSENNFTKHMDSDSQSVISGILQVIKNASPTLNYSELRQQWLETEINIQKVPKAVPITMISAAIDKIYQIFNHTKFIDSIEELVSEHVSLRSLWYFRHVLQVVYDKVITDSDNQSLFSLSYLVLLSQFVENATQFDPPEKDRIGQECVATSAIYINKVIEQIAQNVEQMGQYFNRFNHQIDDSNAMHLIIEKLELKRPEKWQPPPKPGFESDFSGRKSYEPLRLIQKNLYHLCSSLNQYGSVFIYNTLFTPREFLVSRLKKSLKQYIDLALFVPPDRVPFKDETKTINPPSLIYKQIFNYCCVVKSIESQINIDCDRLINEVMLKQVYTPSLGVFGGKLDWMYDKNFEFANNLVRCVATWYSDFFAKRIGNPQLNICYSPNRKGFYSRRGQVFRAEKYFELTELQKLVSLIGPYGVKVIDKEILRFILSNMSTLKETLKTYANDLNDLQTNYHKEAISIQVLKNVRVQDVDQFVQRSIIIGNALQFRKLLYEAVGMTLSETIPHIQKTVYNAFNQYNRNVFMASDLVGMDSLSQDVGIDVGVADQALKTMLAQLPSQDRQIWDLLPSMYAISFINSTYWKESTYNPIIEAHENNCHVLVKTINDFLINFKALSKTTDDDIVSSLNKFMDISATLLLRALQREKSHKDFASVFVFFDIFVEQCPLLTRNELEDALPYCLLRSMWRTIYGREVKGRKDGEEVY